MSNNYYQYVRESNLYEILPFSEIIIDIILGYVNGHIICNFIHKNYKYNIDSRYAIKICVTPTEINIINMYATYYESYSIQTYSIQTSKLINSISFLQIRSNPHYVLSLINNNFYQIVGNEIMIVSPITCQIINRAKLDIIIFPNLYYLHNDKLFLKHGYKIKIISCKTGQTLSTISHKKFDNIWGLCCDEQYIIIGNDYDSKTNILFFDINSYEFVKEYNWYCINNNPPFYLNVNVHSIISNKTNIYIMTDSGIIYSLNKKTNKTELYSALPDLSFPKSLCIDNHHLFVVHQNIQKNIQISTFLVP